jgi:heptosyltransferase-2
MKKNKPPFPIPDCKRFNGYKPCQAYKVCPCDDPVPVGQSILIVNLDFIGDVLMTTAMLPPLKRKYPESTIHWITQKNALPVLQNNPFLDKVWEWNDENRMILKEMLFDEVLNSDKNLNSSAFTMGLKADRKLGFGLNSNGAIIPLNPEALYNYRMGLDDRLKFKQNTRTGLDILAETWKLHYLGDEYVLQLTEKENQFCSDYRKLSGVDTCRFVLGFNTGCSHTFPLKKMTIEHHVYLIRRLSEQLDGIKILLLGGPEDTERNRDIKSRVGDMVIETPTTEGLRRGILYENCCDCVVSGDSLGMHIAIGLKKVVVAWFGLSCGVEIELFGRGEKIMPDLDCSPCWKKSCEDPRCIRELDLDRIFNAIGHAYKSTAGIGRV